MPRRVIVRPDAEADIAAAFDWYEGQQSGLGHEFLNEIERCISRIADHPESYPTIHRQYRQALTKRFPYKVFYIAEADIIRVFAVLHTTRHRARDQRAQAAAAVPVRYLCEIAERGNGAVGEVKPRELRHVLIKRAC